MGLTAEINRTEPNTRDSGPDLLTALRGLDQLLERAVIKAKSVYGTTPGSDPYRGLYINDDEVNRLLTREPGTPAFGIDRKAGDTGVSEDLTKIIESSSSLVTLGKTFGLSIFDCAVVLIAVAVDIDLGYQRLFAYLQDDVTRRRATVDLALNLLCDSSEEKSARRVHFSAGAPLIRQGLLRLIPDNSQSDPALLSHHLKLDEQITHHLLGQRVFDSRLPAFCDLSKSEVCLDEILLTTEVKRALQSLAKQATKTQRALRLHFSGVNSADKRLAAEAVAVEIGAPLLLADLSRTGLAELDFGEGLRLIFREACIHQAVLYLDGLDILSEDNQLFKDGSLRNALIQHNGIVILSTEQRSIPSLLPTGHAALGLIEVPFPIPAFDLRREAWKTNTFSLEPDQLDALAGRFQLTPSQIAEAVAQAQNLTLWRSSEEAADGSLNAPPDISDFYAAARAQASHALASLAHKIDPIYDWKDIVLPDDALAQLREICKRVEHREQVMQIWGFGQKISLGKGISALFAGPSGTGKTMAADIIARELNLDLYKIDLSTVVSKYIGETEKNLDRIFAAAENSNAIVFIDECDSLMGKRSEVRDAHDRYANIEIAYLLQKMEEYEGIVILATNLRQNLDESFTRRLTFTVHFQFPDELDRRRIWAGIWPAAIPLGPDVDLDFLARQFKLSGGNIKNIALAAAFFAAAEDGVVTMSHLVQATRREYQKLGKPLGLSELGAYAPEVCA
jgi:SpoVK/Ycf46/Vps4 family AAA+-type ATPase